MELPRIARKPIQIDVDATLPNGDPATVGAVDVAFCDHDGPTAATVWVPTAFNSSTRIAEVILVGREAADKSGALELTTARAELWAKPAGGSAVDAGFIDTVESL